MVDNPPATKRIEWVAFSKEEIQKMIANTKDLPKEYAEILYQMMITGKRLDEVLKGRTKVTYAEFMAFAKSLGANRILSFGEHEHAIGDSKCSECWGPFPRKCEVCEKGLKHCSFIDESDDSPICSFMCDNPECADTTDPIF